MQQPSNLFGAQASSQPFTSTFQNPSATGMFGVSGTSTNLNPANFNDMRSANRSQLAESMQAANIIDSNLRETQRNSGMLSIPDASKNMFSLGSTSTSAEDNLLAGRTTQAPATSLFKFVSSVATSTNDVLHLNATPSNDNIGAPTRTSLFTVPVSTTTPNMTNLINATTAVPSIPSMSSLLVNSMSKDQIQPILRLNSSTSISQVSKQEAVTKKLIPINQQQVIASLLLDPYANRGENNCFNINSSQIHSEPAAVSISTTTIATTSTIITSTSKSPTFDLQVNPRKVPSFYSPVNVNFKLKPVSSLSNSNDTTNLCNQQPIVLTDQPKCAFTNEEELILLSRNKMSKLRLSHFIMDSPYQSNAVHSLYPERRLAELENIIDIMPSSLSSSPSSLVVAIDNQSISFTKTETRDALSNNHSTSPILHEKSLPPIVERKLDNRSPIDRLPILTRDHYYMKPTRSELKSSFNNKGQCILSQLTVGHEKYGSITFYGRINVTGLDLDDIIQINHHEVIVYPDDDKKPVIGEELNLPARITLFGIYPIDRSTQNVITDSERIKAMNYEDYLRKITEKFDGEFINYGIHDGSWTFMVKHFTRYGLNANENNFYLNPNTMNPDITTSLNNEYNQVKK